MCALRQFTKESTDPFCMVFSLILYFREAWFTLKEKFEMQIISLKNWSQSGQQDLG